MRANTLKAHKDHLLEAKKQVLTKALGRMMERLLLSRRELSAIIGLSEPSLSRVFTKPNFYIDPATTEGQLTLLLLRLYRSLDTLFGGDATQCQQWLRSKNKHLGGPTPIQLIQTIQGLVLTVHYLDAIRGKN